MTEPALNTLAPTADRVFLNGRVITVNARDEVAEALAVAGNRILRVGSRAYVEQTVGRDTETIDLRGRALIPGLYENHIHMTNAFQRHWLDCTYEAATSIADVVACVAARAQETPPGTWILGRGFQGTRLAERRNPNREDLDPVSPNHPVGIANREAWAGRSTPSGSGASASRTTPRIRRAGRWSATTPAGRAARCGTTPARCSSTRT